MTRFRSDTIANDSKAWSTVGKYSNIGSCNVTCAQPTQPWGFGNLSGNSQTKYTYKSMEDVVTPEFKKISGKGGIVNSPMTKIDIDKEIPVCDIDLRGQFQKYGCDPLRWYNYYNYSVTGTRSMESVCGNDLFIPTIDLDYEDLVSKAVTAAHAKIGAADMLLLATLKEGNQAVKGLWYILRKVHRISRAVKHAEFKALKRELKISELEEVYMNARYNLRPMYYDAKAIYKILNHVKATTNRATFRGYGTDAVTASDVIHKELLNVNSYATYSVEISRNISRTVTVRSGVLGERVFDSTAQMFGIDRIIESAWDVLPYSFILGWFINIGDTIASWTPNAGVNVLSSWYTVSDTVLQKSTIGSTNINTQDIGGYHVGKTSANVSPTVATQVTTTKTRVPDPARSKLPRIAVKLDPAKILDLIIITGWLKRNRGSSPYSSTWIR